MKETRKYYIAEILESLFEEFKDVSDFRFINSRPEVLDGDPKDYLVIRWVSLRDRADTYQTAVINLHLFVKAKPGGIEDVLKMEKLTERISRKFPILKERYSAGNLTALSVDGYDTGFHYRILQFSLTIHKGEIRKENEYLNNY